MYTAREMSKCGKVRIPRGYQKSLFFHSIVKLIVIDAEVIEIILIQESS